MSQYDLSRPVVQQVREAADIVAVIGDVITLKHRGRNWLGLCPFHGEKTPSFNVSREKGTYYCFGCKKGGDAIDFVMETERLSFAEAVERLADRFGVVLPMASPEARRRRDESSEITAALEAAQAVFHRSVHEDRPRAFLERRGVDPPTVLDFGLGFAPGEWRGLCDALKGKVAERTLVAAGLAVQGEDGRLWDRFRDRVTIPIHSSRGGVIAFGGRTLGDDPAKYLNSPETALFSKSQTLFALDRAVRVFARTERCLVVEGYFDCIALHAAGFGETVATLGTSLTEHHARELQRRVRRVVVCFDGDAAGRRAALAALRTLLGLDLEVRVLLLPSDQDPDDIVRREGSEGFARRLDGALREADFLIGQMGSSREERRVALRASLEIVDVCRDAVRRYALREELARAAGVPVEQLGEVESPRVVASGRPVADLPPPGELALLRAILVDLPPARRGEALRGIPPDATDHPLTRAILKKLAEASAEGRALEISQLTSDIDERDVRRLLAALEHEAPETTDEGLQLILRELWDRQRKKRLALLNSEIARAERQGDSERLQQLLQEWLPLSKRTTPS
ncbi:MAG TPA: DNA primase [Thermoanaerobaculaceae bacterium]|nr:DNA primase [Thermoanaerobaculaceae bacterium]HPS76816.1 DNA primase [Thermoanaerobaculaceae bacterium]